MARPKRASTKDTVPAKLQPGEFVVKRSAVKKLGERAMEKINTGRLPKRKAR